MIYIYNALSLINSILWFYFIGYIAEHTAYHHGEASLHATIINMAQDFVGSNNVPLLTASGIIMISFNIIYSVYIIEERINYY